MTTQDLWGKHGLWLAAELRVGRIAGLRLGKQYALQVAALRWHCRMRGYFRV